MDYAVLKQNLLDLTKAVASDYGRHESPFFASRAYRQFENRMIDEMVRGYYKPARQVFVDLGCATGAQVVRAAPYFEWAYGFDVSGDMIEHANQRLDQELAPKVLFRQIDLEEGIPLETGSVSVLTMGMGTASDIRNISDLLVEIQRILKRSGKFLLSFYNRDALVYSWKHLPWADEKSIAAEMDHTNEFLNVHVGEKVFSVYARAYTMEEVKDLMPKRLTVQDVVTYPSISSILPESAFEEERACNAILALDKKLSTFRQGAYLIVTGERSMFD